MMVCVVVLMNLSYESMPVYMLSVPAQSIQVFKPIGHPWHIVTAICVQRFPKLVQQKSPLELEFRSLQNQIKFERSRLSDHELEEIMHLRKKRAREKKALEEDVDVSQVSGQYPSSKSAMSSSVRGRH